MHLWFSALFILGINWAWIQSIESESSEFDCTFEEDFCNWTLSETGDFNWTRDTGDNAPYNTGPKIDHTHGDEQSYYALFDSSKTTYQDKTARLVSPAITEGTHCLKFYYMMNGASVNQFNVYTAETGQDSGMTLIFRKDGDHGPVWIPMLKTIQSGSTFNIILEGVSGLLLAGDIAVDDITVRQGACPGLEISDTSGAFNCTFDEAAFPSCNFTIKGGNTWQVNSAQNSSSATTDPFFDHTYGAYTGHYMLSTAANQDRATKALLVSQIYHGRDETHCLRFFYNIDGDEVGSLNVYQVHEFDLNDLGKVRWHRYLEKTTGWARGIVNLPIIGPYMIVFESVGWTVGSKVAIDDISVSSGECPDYNTCSFESGQCFWRNIKSDNNWDWVLTSPDRSGGLNADHTGNSKFGGVMMATFSGRWERYADLLTEVQRAVNTSDSCFRFWFFIPEGKRAPLSVVVYTNTSYGSPTGVQQLWSLDLGKERHGWTHVSVAIDKQWTQQPFVIGIKAEIRVYAFVAIDDTDLEQESCSTITGMVVPAVKTRTATSTLAPTSSFKQNPTERPGQRTESPATSKQNPQDTNLSKKPNPEPSTSDAASGSMTPDTPPKAKPQNPDSERLEKRNAKPSDSWKLPVGLVCGFLCVVALACAVVIYFRRTGRLNGQPFSRLQNIIRRSDGPDSSIVRYDNGSSKVEPF